MTENRPPTSKVVHINVQATPDSVKSDRQLLFDSNEDFKMDVLPIEVAYDLDKPKSDQSGKYSRMVTNGIGHHGNGESLMVNGARHDSISCPDLTTLHRDNKYSKQNPNGNKLDVEDLRGQSTSRGTNFWNSLRTAIRISSAISSKSKRKHKHSNVQRYDSFLEKFTTRQHGKAEGEGKDIGSDCGDDEEEDYGCNCVIDPDGDFLYYWLMIVTLAVVYNFWILIARQAWVDLHEASPALWFTLDYMCDAIYILDVIVQFRTGFLRHGIVERSTKHLAVHYIKSRKFLLDALSLSPTDFLYFLNLERCNPIVRIPRLLKVGRAIRFYQMTELRTPHPNIFRVLNFLHVLLLLTHWFAALYQMISVQIDDQSSSWVIPNLENETSPFLSSYLRSFYWSTITLTTIGDIPQPGSNYEYVVQIIGYLIGVFIFATIVGQVGSVIENRNAARMEFERCVDNAKRYMRENRVPKDMQSTILRWYYYTWSRGQIKGHSDVNSIGLLPVKLRTELALHVNLATLKRVIMFQKCPPEFLHELVLKMHLTVYTPGELVCRKGEIAREMFIISDGLLEVVRGDGHIITTLGTGDVVGEIGILNLEGSTNRRMANVRSAGYSEVFTLSKEDVLNAITDFPQAQEILEDEARKRLLMSNDEPILPSPPLSARSIHSSKKQEGNKSLRGSMVDKMRRSGIITGKPKSPRPMSFRERTAPTVDVAPFVTGSTSDRLYMSRRATLDPLPSHTFDRMKGDKTDDVAAEITASIEKVVHSKIEGLLSENKLLQNRSGQLEVQVRKLQEENERKTDELAALRRRLKELQVLDHEGENPVT